MINPFGTSPHIIAEIGVNHEGSLERAKTLIVQAARAGVQSVKLQFYKSELLASKDASSYWNRDSESTASQLALFSKYDNFGADHLATLSDFAHECGVDFGLSIFHLEAVQEVGEFVDYWKIASGDITFTQLIKAVAATQKPIVVSTGASLADEVIAAFDILRDHEFPVVFLQCTLQYPTDLNSANVASVTTLRRLLPKVIVGTSDHIAEISTLRFQLALALGARVFEKHFSDVPGSAGNDHYHAWGEGEFQRLVTSFSETFDQLGSGQLFLESEEPARYGARRSGYFKNSLKKGSVLCETDVIALRPGGGVSPNEFQLFIGKTLSRDVDAGSRIEPGDFENGIPS